MFAVAVVFSPRTVIGPDRRAVSTASMAGWQIANPLPNS